MKFVKALTGAAVLALLLGACAGEFPQSSIDPKTDFARSIHGLYTSIFVWTMVILAVVWGVLAYVLIRFRERADSPRPRQVHGHFGLEVAWTAVPALIVVAIAVPTVQAVFAGQRPDPERSMVVDVVGHQFWWEFRYPDEGVVTANEVHLPVGEAVSLRIWSADVIHSFWVPQLGGKRDANPLLARPEGEEPDYNWLHFTIEEPGVYMGQCAEFCGPSHSLMGIRVVAESRDDFDAWLADYRAAGAPEGPAPEEGAVGEADEGAAAGSEEAAGAEEEVPSEEAVPASQDLPAGLEAETVARGREIFERSTCVACHAIEGSPAQGVVGPDLTLLGRRSTVAAGWLDNSVENLERWITSPRSVKPGALMPGVDEAGGGWPATNLSEEQVRAVAQYLFSLR